MFLSEHIEHLQIFAQMSQHLHPTTLHVTFRIINKTFEKEFSPALIFIGRVLFHLFTCMLSFLSFKQNSFCLFPISSSSTCTYSSTSLGSPQCMIRCMSGQSIPIPNAIAAKTNTVYCLLQ